MKKNVSIPYILLLLPLINFVPLSGMYGEIDTSTINFQSPTTQGLGLSYYLGDKYYGKTGNTLKMLEQRQFKSENISCHNKLREAIISLCYEEKNIPDTIKLINLMTKNFRAPESPQNLKSLNLELASFCNIHEFLSNEKTTKQEELKAAIEEADKNFIIKYNEEIKSLKQLWLDKAEQLKKIRIEHIDKRTQQIKQAAQEIKEIKNGLVELHQLNQKQKTFCPQNNNFDDEYCSDSEKTPADVEKTYSDENLTRKIKIDILINSTNKLTQDQIKQIEQLFITFNSKIQPINTYTYNLQ